MKGGRPELLEVSPAKLEGIVERSRTGALDEKDHGILKASVETFIWLMSELEKKEATLAYLRKQMSIDTKKTEKMSEVLKGVDGTESPQGDDEESPGHAEEGQGDDEEGQGDAEEKSGEEKDKKKPKGHGRNGADAYEGAERKKVPHESLKPGDSCPLCEKGKVYRKKPLRLVRLRGQEPIAATIYEVERLRCNLCGEVFRARAPTEAGEKKYDETAASMIGLLKYGSGMPLYRLQRLERNFGIPLPPSTQWDILAAAATGILGVAYKELIRQGAQGDIFYNDDTSMKILALLKENEQIEAAGSKERTGMFTSSIIVSTSEGRRIALFFTGREHAGENLERVLKKRASELDPPLQMCDGLSRNIPKELATLLANCLTHGRRKFVEIVDNFPQECRYVIETLAEVYSNDATTRKQEMSAQERLRFHQAHSAEPMAELKRWMTEQIEEKKIEPNSSLGAAISYMLKRWDKLTLFLRVPGAPLDNNICERALKKAILHRKNALFYKTENGARVGDIYMSLIYTAELSGANPFDYLTELQKHTEELRRNPHEWMPWNYEATVAALAETGPVDDPAAMASS